MKAKITDLGNSRLVDPAIASHSKTMTQVPGTLLYMPPEAMEVKAKYSSKLNIFSFGHLALFTVTQNLPLELLAFNFTDSKGRLHARTEVEWCNKDIALLCEKLGGKHSLVSLIKQYLHNSTEKRPSAAEILQKLEVSLSMDRGKSDGDTDDYEVIYNKMYPLSKGEMVEYISQKEFEIKNLKKHMDDRSADSQGVS